MLAVGFGFFLSSLFLRARGWGQGSNIEGRILLYPETLIVCNMLLSKAWGRDVQNSVNPKVTQTFFTG